MTSSLPMKYHERLYVIFYKAFETCQKRLVSETVGTLYFPVLMILLDWLLVRFKSISRSRPTKYIVSSNLSEMQ